MIAVRLSGGDETTMDGRDGFGGDFDVTLAAARAGAAWALDRIYTTLSPTIAAFFRVQGAAEPDDLTSEVFLGVLRNVGTFDGDETRFRSWVFTIAYRRLSDERRRLARRPPTEPLAKHPDLPAADDVEADLDWLLATEHLRQLFGRLAPAQRDVLLLRVLGRLSIDEVARTLGKTAAAVKGLQRRGFVALARHVEQGVRP